MQHRYLTRFVAMLQNKLHVFVAHWVILENIHTIPWMAQGNSEGKAGNAKACGGGGDAYDWNSQGMVGEIDLEFPPGTDTSVFLENAFEKANIQTGRRLTIMEF